MEPRLLAPDAARHHRVLRARAPCRASRHGCDHEEPISLPAAAYRRSTSWWRRWRLAAAHLTPHSGSGSPGSPHSLCPSGPWLWGLHKMEQGGCWDAVRLRSTRWQAETSPLVALVPWRSEGGAALRRLPWPYSRALRAGGSDHFLVFPPMLGAS